jgi:Zn-dependent peptidase ImmA (M78 family)
MPYLSEKIKIAKTKHDKRCKLTDVQKEEIREEYKDPESSQRKLARKYNVSRRLIQYILDPEKLKENRRRRLERGGWRQYYDSEKNTKYMRTHRAYKQKLHIEGVI